MNDHQENPAVHCRTWLDIDLTALKQNYRTVTELTNARVTCVLKSNAYGHGAVETARALLAAGCDSMAVSCVREALELRMNGIDCEILVMGTCETWEMEDAIREHLLLTAADPDFLDAAGRAAEAIQEDLRFHLKIDTGFHRLGFPPEKVSADGIASICRRHPRLRAEGVYSHLGLITEERDRRQAECLFRMRDWLCQAGLRDLEMHLCDSIGLVRYPEYHLNRVRVGAFLFGVRPSRSESMSFQDPETLCFRTRVVQIHNVPAGDAVGYTENMVLDRNSRIATLCAGYGDGYPRCLSNGQGQVLIRGRRAPVLGLVCMDQMMVDITDIPECENGDVVTLLGGGISYGEYADWARTNRNECLAMLSDRPVRIYHQEDRQIIRDDLLGTRKEVCL